MISGINQMRNQANGMNQSGGTQGGRRKRLGGILLLSAFLLTWIPSPLSADSIFVQVKKDGQPAEEELETGKVTKVTRNEVVIKDKAGIESSLPANQIIAIQFDDEPVNLQVARTAIDSSQYEDALTKLGEIKGDEIDAAGDFIRQDYEFYRAQAASRLALSGSPDVTLRKAGARLNDFVKKNPESFHFYEANRILGNILIAMEDYKNAKNFFEILAGAPWEEMKIEGNIALGNILLNEGDLDGAQKGFEGVLSADDTADGVREQKNFAQIGLGRIASQRGDDAKAQEIFNAVIAAADPDDYLLQAKLYNAVGDAALKAGKEKEAILAYLHVDLLYSSASAEHVKALRHLVSLWKKQLRDDRAADAQSILREKYKINE